MFSFLSILCLSRLGVYGIDTVAHLVFKGTIRRGDEKTKPSLIFGRKDLIYMGVNQLVETLFIQKLLVLCVTLLERDGDVHIYTMSYIFKSYLLAIAILFLDDLGYEQFHKLLHVNKFLYVHIHAHHHKSKAPCVGYLEAINEHPLEMVGALLINLAVIKAILPWLTSLSLFMFLTMKSVFAITNHLDCNVELFGGVYKSDRHKEHHFRLTKNYGQM